MYIYAPPCRKPVNGEDDYDSIASNTSFFLMISKHHLLISDPQTHSNQAINLRKLPTSVWGSVSAGALV